MFSIFISQMGPIDFAMLEMELESIRHPSDEMWD